PKRRRRLDSSHDSSTATTPPDDFPPAVAFSTHDISRVPNHISTLDHVAKQIHSAAAEAWDRRFQYKNVFALLLHWQDDDLQVAPEVAALASTFRNVYHYATETWRIPTLKPDWDIKERLIRFLRANDAEGHLVIFYYAGHAMKNPQPGGAPLWSS
ncbi:guanine nucleotide exchange factor subunit rich, partial [Podospora aff. communis PSN243]